MRNIATEQGWVFDSGRSTLADRWENFGFALVWLIAFAIPWGDMLLLPYEVQASRGLTLVIAPVWLLIGWRTRRLRRLEGAHWWMLLFILWAAANLMWSPEPDRSFRRVLSYYQLFMVVWLIHQCAATWERCQKLLLAFVCGCYVAFAGLMYNYLSNIYQGDGRYTAPGLDPNDLAVTLALGIPAACYLSMRMKRLRWITALYTPCAILAGLLTASRGGLVTLAIALLFPLLALPKARIKVLASFLLLFGVTAVAVLSFESDISIHRLSTIAEQLTARDLNGRVDIWKRGFDAFLEHPVAGVGAGAFGNAIGFRQSRDIAAHNTLLGVLVEHGLIGLTFFAGAITSLFLRAAKDSKLERRLWMVLLLAWTVAVTTLSWENKELTWLIWGLCAGHPLVKARTNPCLVYWSPYAHSPSTA